MQRHDTEEAIALVADAMNSDEGAWARTTFEYYFSCLEAGIDSGRDYRLWRHNRAIAGLVGLHQYLWGPPENVWLSWFAVRTDMQGQGAGKKLLGSIENAARKRGFAKMLIETYDSDTFTRARGFYERNGYAQTGGIREYLPDGSSMVVYAKNL